jgi:hypothetical protein
MNPMMSEVYAALRLDFHSFVHRCFLQLNPHAEFFDNWHIADGHQARGLAVSARSAAS